MRLWGEGNGGRGTAAAGVKRGALGTELGRGGTGGVAAVNSQEG